MSTAPPPAASLPRTSPFLTPHPHSTPSSLSILHLRRDQHLPIILQSSSAPSDGYLEGPVTNTRFGSFPHSTLVNQPWGSQIRASEVDTGSRGRKGWEGKGKKRKRGEGDEAVTDEQELGIEEERARKEIKTAASGFVHILPPTPELWTSSLPHRTQVVYTPDYSYILHRLRARPGSVVIEAGAGSGSFTHAAARAVFNGYPRPTTTNTSTQTEEPADLNDPQSAKQGKVYSFEFHEPRCAALKQEIQDHGLSSIVELTHRDVCSEGFLPDTDPPIHADAIFLDLPAPWLALKHLTRRIRRKPSPLPTPPQNPPQPPSPRPPDANPPPNAPSQPPPAIPPETTPNPALHPALAVHVCTFSPCIEQVTRTISTLRSLGWLDISMVELSAKKIEVRRERVGLQEEGLRGVNASPANVNEAVERLREVEGRTRWFHEMEARKERDAELAGQVQAEEGNGGVGEKGKYISKRARLASIASAVSTRKLYKEGRLIHRPEPELKMHTSYLVFAVLPREWSEEDEREAQAVYIGDAGGDKGNGKGVGARTEKAVSKRQRRKEAKRKKLEEGGGGGDGIGDEVSGANGAMGREEEPEQIQDGASVERMDEGGFRE
ncbi:tRNA (adenine(58)-N(1))-methyltransferase catalytic subunit trm61 [Physcia stellaris]|nr:tRNA (adenine(58)-N(1))-methyltransferase catalytic subunit trm61 [Physcia stellaris]